MATLETQVLDEVIAGSRRRMLSLGGTALAGLALTSIAADAQTTLTDADYLNFALNLEYLEAEFYTLAASGMTIDQMGLGINGSGTQGTVTVKAGGPAACKVPFTNSLVQSYVQEVATEERNHVNFLRSALGTGTAVAQPALDLVNSFNYLASQLGLGLTSFDPFANDINFLLGAYIFEDVGVTAYTGAAPALTSSSNLDAAAGIQAVEAYHAGLIRTTIYGLDQAATTLGPAGMATKVAAAISHLRATVDGSNSITSTRQDGDDIGLGTQMVMLNTSSSFIASALVNASTTGSINTAASGGTANSLAFSRTAAQVLAIVYAGGTTTSNQGFFRAGLNGNVK
jgi:hypothetical protein